MYKAPRGTTDILPADQPYWRYVQAKAAEISQRFGYSRIDTPVFEDSNLYVRSVGEGTDIVEKETYTFKDKGGEMISLRPEGTAGVCRAYVEHGMVSLPQPVRLSYMESFFRYERPQAGRFRQFHQFGVEAIGDADASIDAEVIELGWRFIHDLGLGNMTLVLNSIGDKECRPVYLKALREHYAANLQRVCPDCKMRFEKNLLRVLDCKRTDFSCQEVISDAPKATEHLCAPCKEHWEQLTSYITALGIPMVVNHKLVRGLDYYTRSVFEIQPQEEGAQSTILAGGRYDGLIEELGGKPTPGVGFATGIERIILNLKRQNISVDAPETYKVMVAHLGKAADLEAVALASELRKAGISAAVASGGKSLKAQMRQISALGAPTAVIIGDNEIEQKSVVVRDMAKAAQITVPRVNLISFISDLQPDQLP